MSAVWCGFLPPPPPQPSSPNQHAEKITHELIVLDREKPMQLADREREMRLDFDMSKLLCVAVHVEFPSAIVWLACGTQTTIRKLQRTENHHGDMCRLSER